MGGRRRGTEPLQNGGCAGRAGTAVGGRWVTGGERTGTGPGAEEPRGARFPPPPPGPCLSPGLAPRPAGPASRRRCQPPASSFPPSPSLLPSASLPAAPRGLASCPPSPPGAAVLGSLSPVLALAALPQSQAPPSAPRGGRSLAFLLLLSFMRGFGALPRLLTKGGFEFGGLNPKIWCQGEGTMPIFVSVKKGKKKFALLKPPALGLASPSLLPPTDKQR